MGSVAKQWVICGNHGVTIVTVLLFFLVLFVIKAWLIFIREGIILKKRKNLTLSSRFACLSDGLFQSKKTVIGQKKLLD